MDLFSPNSQLGLGDSLKRTKEKINYFTWVDSILSFQFIPFWRSSEAPQGASEEIWLDFQENAPEEKGDLISRLSVIWFILYVEWQAPYPISFLQDLDYTCHPDGTKFSKKNA